MINIQVETVYDDNYPMIYVVLLFYYRVVQSVSIYNIFEPQYASMRYVAPKIFTQSFITIEFNTRNICLINVDDFFFE